MSGVGGVVLWDFDGTLATRPGMWSGALLEALDAVRPGYGLVRDDVRPFLHGAYPWHHAEVAHPELGDPAAWWAHVGAALRSALDGCGVAAADAEAAVAAFPATYLDPAAWVVHPDSVPALVAVRTAGMRNVVVSNHVPELAGLVDALLLGPWLDGVVTSALAGFEKPHPGIFEVALDLAGRPAQVWMVGDNPVADVAGAAALGIPAVLVGRAGADGVEVTPLDAVRRILGRHV